MTKGVVVALVLALLIVAGGYMSWRGISREEFRMVGRSGWHRLSRYTFHWWYASVFNVAFTLGLCAVAITMISRGEFR
ncbi:MAG: hypothetical protein J7500_09670 [Sphingomonas sp.]|uniref:hypothetical protein n=1 Tax=Sphingomonas sp. TaxID=28214 RepID=UPI001AFDF9D6|nr:hypothetical protein [Sphingomonas sp.]MBO9622966.1 hypothetical protein [Sphingomonas sp.]